MNEATAGADPSMRPGRPAIVRSIADLRAVVASWRAAGERVALVPTMGALHAGHLALVGEALARADRVVVSIFVNPTQFAPHEDFQSYPRTEATDVAALATLSTDLVFAPAASEIYPLGHATRIVPAGAAEGLESDFRPHFFAGVATVVAKLLIACGPDVAIFGEKDWQQLAVVRQMVRDLALPVEIVGAATVREADGLALSSRNAYLTAGERAIAPRLPAEMGRVIARLRAGESAEEVLADAKAALLAAGFARIDYLEVRNAVTLAPPREAGEPLRLLAALWLGRTRLIDNMAV